MVDLYKLFPKNESGCKERNTSAILKSLQDKPYFWVMKFFTTWTVKLSAIMLSALCLMACGEKQARNSEANESERPNIILIVVDDQGYADFEPFEIHDPAISTPNLAALGKSGTVFTQAYVTAPVCSPSRAGLLTGKNQFRWDTRAGWGPGLPDSVKTLAEYLKSAGYATAKIGKNDLGQKFHRNDVREYPTEHGFDEFLGFSAHAHDYWLLSDSIRERTPDPYNTSALLGPLMHNNGEKSFDDGYLTDILTDEAIAYLDKKRENPFFLMLSYNAVHHLVHEVPKKYLARYGAEPIANYDPDSLMAYGKHEAGTYSAYYDKYSRIGDIDKSDMRHYYLANLESLDDNIGRFMKALKRAELDKNTLVVFMSDNGGSPLTGANNAPLTAGKYSLWEGGIRIPLAMSWPGRVAAGKVEDRYVSTLDILPTLTAAANIQLQDSTLDGRSLLHPDNDRLLVWKWQKNWAVRLGDWKLTNTRENHWKSEPSAQYIPPIANDTLPKLFNLAKDPGEREDLARSNPERVAVLREAYDAWCREHLGSY